MDRQELSTKDSGMCYHGNFAAQCPSCKETREQSWGAIEKFIARLEATADSDVLKNVEKVEAKDEVQSLVKAKEIVGFMRQHFGPEESVSVKTQALNIREGITNDYVARSPEGKIMSWVDSINIKVPGEEGHPDKLMFTTWYVAADKEQKGKTGTKELYVQALKDFLSAAKSQDIETLGISGETEEEVQLLFNRFGTKRIYMETKKGVNEVGYYAPPEDESDKGVPEHIMLYLADGRSEMSTTELMNIVRAIHRQYTRDEFFTPEMVAEYEEVDPSKVTPKQATRYHEGYKRIASTATDKVEKSLLNAVGQKVKLMSAREIKSLKTQGVKVNEIQDEE